MIHKHSIENLRKKAGLVPLSHTIHSKNMPKKINRIKFERTRQAQPKRKNPIQKNRGKYISIKRNKRPAVTSKRNKGSENPV
jgi:hypothetical protein